MWKITFTVKCGCSQRMRWHQFNNRCARRNSAISHVNESCCHPGLKAFLWQSGCNYVPSVLLWHTSSTACEWLDRYQKSTKHCVIRHSQLASRLMQLLVCRLVGVESPSSSGSAEHIGTCRRPPAKVRQSHGNIEELHWLPVRSSVNFKVSKLAFKVQLSGLPCYLAQLIVRRVPSSALRSASEELLVVPRIWTSLGDMSFSYTAPSIWNSLPLSIRQCKSLYFCIAFKKN